MEQRIILFFILMLAIIPHCQAQMLYNGGFEKYTKCPIMAGQIYASSNWHGNERTPDYYNQCSPKKSMFSIPVNHQGFCPSLPNSNAYAGLFLVWYNSKNSFSHNYKENEFIYTKLTTKLIEKCTYNISFYIYLSDSSKLKNDTIHICLSKNKPAYEKGYLVPDGQIVSAVIENKSKEWQKISVNFSAKESFNYLCLGLFRERFSKKEYKNVIASIVNRKSIIAPVYSYYYIDNIVLSDICD